MLDGFSRLKTEFHKTSILDEVMFLRELSWSKFHSSLAASVFTRRHIFNNFHKVTCSCLRIRTIQPQAPEMQKDICFVISLQYGGKRPSKQS